MGVKIRQGSFEIKALQAPPRIIDFPSGVSGWTDGWVKWSYNRPAVEAWVQALLLESEGWVDVTKTRWLRTYSFDAAPLAKVAPGQRLQNGCRVEVTGIRALDRDWWTVALQAFGEPARLRENLRQAGRAFFRSHPPLDPFHPAQSCSYPAWLAGL